MPGRPGTLSVLGWGVFNTAPNGSDTANPHYTIVADQPIDVSVLYKNYGRTPAITTAIYYEVSIGEAPPESTTWTTEIPNISCRSHLIGINGGPVFPSEDGFYQFDRQDPADRISIGGPDKDAIVAGKKGLYVVGCIGYADLDGTTRYTDFCFYLAHEIGQPSGVFAFCGKGNFTQ
jgi:hypothetical protein